MSNPITSTKPKKRKFNLLPPCNNKTHNNKEKLETRCLNINISKNPKTHASTLKRKQQNPQKNHNIYKLLPQPINKTRSKMHV
jgi:hypothetical protein